MKLTNLIRCLALSLTIGLNFEIRTAFAQEAPPKTSGKNAQQGSIDLKLQDDAGVDPYGKAQDDAIQYFQGLSVKLKDFSNGNSSALENLSDRVILHLAAAYLYASIRQGTAPSVLESIFEIDLVNSRLNKKASCPNMKKFWKVYLDSDFENRHRFAVKTGFIADTNRFNSTVRPKFVHCEKTIEELIAAKETDAQFFKARYGASPSPVQSAEKLTALLSYLKSKDINVVASANVK